MRQITYRYNVRSITHRRPFSPVARMDPQEAHYKIDTKHTVKAGDDGSLWRYMVQHSHRPTPELDELQQVRSRQSHVRLICCLSR